MPQLTLYRLFSVLLERRVYKRYYRGELRATPSVFNTPAKKKQPYGFHRYHHLSHVCETLTPAKKQSRAKLIPDHMDMLACAARQAGGQNIANLNTSREHYQDPLHPSPRPLRWTLPQARESLVFSCPRNSKKNILLFVESLYFASSPWWRIRTIGILEKQTRTKI